MHSRPLDRTRRAGQSPMRVPFDFYATPPEATRALLTVEGFDAPIWEPACGDGAISRPLIEAGHDVVSTDLIDRGYGTAGIDFIRESTRAPSISLPIRHTEAASPTSSSARHC